MTSPGRLHAHGDALNAYASLVVDMAKAACRCPGDIIERHHPGKGSQFPRLARRRRGATLWVEKPGRIKMGNAVSVHVPPLVEWQDWCNS